jgi:hypothetical protein
MENSSNSGFLVKVSIPVFLIVSLLWAAYITSSPRVSKNAVRLRNGIDLATVTSPSVEQCTETALREVRTMCCSDEDKPVMGGVDFVALHSQTEGSPVTFGSEQYATYLPTNAGFWKFLFVSEENRNVFMQNPWKYAPAYGGYCGYGIAFEDKSFDPLYVNKLGPYVTLDAWTKYNDKLYFFGGAGPKEKFLAEAERGVELGDAHWSSFYKQDSPNTGHFDTNCFHAPR